MAVHGVEGTGKVDAEDVDGLAVVLYVCSKPSVRPNGISCRTTGTEAALRWGEVVVDGGHDAVEGDEGEDFPESLKEDDRTERRGGTAGFVGLWEDDEGTGVDVEGGLSVEDVVQEFGDRGG